MIKKFTGVTYVPKEFRLMNQCLRCGKVITENSLCESCEKENLPTCEMCEIILKNGIRKYYSYDIKEYKRDEDLIHKVSKELVREFICEQEVNNIYSENKCKDCVGWEERMRNICCRCDECHQNSKDNYKLNGNMCPECSALFQ